MCPAEIDKEKLDKFCQDYGFKAWFATSAKLNKNIGKASRFRAYMKRTAPRHYATLGRLQPDDGMRHPPTAGAVLLLHCLTS